MGKWGKVDFRDFQKLQKKLEKLSRVDTERFMEECAKELAARLLAKVIRRTPVGQYEQSGMKGGTLRRGWTARNEAEAQGGGSSNVKTYAESLTVTKIDGFYQIEIINPVNYGIYVEFGHRTANHEGWVEGRFMLTISEQELDQQTPKILEAKLMKYLGDLFDV